MQKQVELLDLQCVGEHIGSEKHSKTHNKIHTECTKKYDMGSNFIHAKSTGEEYIFMFYKSCILRLFETLLILVNY